MKTDQFSKLPDVELFILKIKTMDQGTKFYKSKNLKAIEKALSSYDYYDYELKSFIVKDSFESDESHELLGLNSLKGEWI